MSTDQLSAVLLWTVTVSNSTGIFVFSLHAEAYVWKDGCGDYGLYMYHVCIEWGIQLHAVTRSSLLCS